MDYQQLFENIASIVTTTRESISNPNVKLSVAAEINERFAEVIADIFDVEYVHQSCLTIEDISKYEKLQEAHKVLSQFIDVGEIRKPMTDDGKHKFLFTFFS